MIVDYLQRNREILIDDLRRFMQQPSVATQNLGMAECAELLCRQMTDFGMAPQAVRCPTAGCKGFRSTRC